MSKMLKSLKLLLKSKFFWIDFLFYFHITLGIPLLFIIVSQFGFQLTTGVIFWVGLFIPILVAKYSKDIQQAKLKEKEFYNKK